MPEDDTSLGEPLWKYLPSPELKTACMDLLTNPASKKSIEVKLIQEEKDAYFAIHPGAAAYFDGEQQSFLDKYADKMFYLSMLLGFSASILAAVWKFMVKGHDSPEERPLMRLDGLTSQIRAASSEAEADRRLDFLLDLDARLIREPNPLPMLH